MPGFLTPRPPPPPLALKGSGRGAAAGAGCHPACQPALRLLLAPLLGGPLRGLRAPSAPCCTCCACCCFLAAPGGGRAGCGGGAAGCLTGLITSASMVMPAHPASGPSRLARNAPAGQGTPSACGARQGRRGRAHGRRGGRGAAAARGGQHNIHANAHLEKVFGALPGQHEVPARGGGAAPQRQRQQRQHMAAAASRFWRQQCRQAAWHTGRPQRIPSFEEQAAEAGGRIRCSTAGGALVFGGGVCCDLGHQVHQVLHRAVEVQAVGAAGPAGHCSTAADGAVAAAAASVVPAFRHCPVGWGQLPRQPLGPLPQRQQVMVGALLASKRCQEPAGRHDQAGRAVGACLRAARHLRRLPWRRWRSCHRLRPGRPAPARGARPPPPPRLLWTSCPCCSAEWWRV